MVCPFLFHCLFIDVFFIDLNSSASFDRMAELTALEEFVDDSNPSIPSFTFHNITPIPAQTEQPAITLPTLFQPPMAQTTSQLPPPDPQWQALLPGALAPAARRPYAPRRCAVCVKSMCRKRLDCKGKGGQKFCRCDHPPLMPGEKPNISEDVIIAHLAGLQG